MTIVTEGNISLLFYVNESRHLNARQRITINIANKSLENETKFKHLAMTVINERHIHEGIKNERRSS